MDIAPASLAQFTKARGGRLVEVDADVQGVANGLAAIDSHIRLRYSEAGGYFCIYWQPEPREGGEEYLIFTAQEIDHRIVKHMEEVYARCNAPGYSFAKELERAEEETKREEDHAWREKNGPLMEKLAWGLRRQTYHDQNSISVSKDVSA